MKYVRGVRFVAAALALLTVLPGHATPSSPLPLEDCGLEPPTLVPPPRPPGKGTPAGVRFTTPFITQVPPRAAHGPFYFLETARPPGTLTGKTVYLSAGHGFTWLNGAWITQRTNNHGIVEDLLSAEAVDQYLAEYLRRMGAYVVTIRESDLQTEKVIVDDADAVATGVTFTGSTDVGYGGFSGALTGETNPFATGTARQLVTHAEPTGELTYAAAIPKDGFYAVYVSYRQGMSKAPDAHFVVRHAAGESHFRVDQRRHGSTWVRLGRYYFAAGGQAEVAVMDDSSAAGTVVSVDAVRFGGGMAVHDRGGGTSPRPQWEMAGRYNAQLSGAPAAVWHMYTNDQQSDAVSRPRFSAWDHEDGEDAIYLAWHTNAPSPGRGTESYTYGSSPPPGPLSNFSGTPGSIALQAAVHGELVDDLKALWDPTWRDRGMFTAYFAEVNPNHNDEMPATLVEIGFHDTAAEAAAMAQPRFRKIATRALAHGIARYFAGADSRTLVLPPETPIRVVFRGHNDGTATLSWLPGVHDAGSGDPATAYRVYLSTDGHAFEGEQLQLTGLEPGQTVFAQVTATNAGGESFPGPVVGVRLPVREQVPMLVVQGFDSLEPEQLVPMDLSAHGLGTVKRMILPRMNDFSYVARHGRAIASQDVAFDTATADAIDGDDVDLAAYAAVDWLTGRQIGPLFTAAARTQLAAYAASGGRLLVSGTDVAARLSAGDAADQAFLTGTLHATLVADDAAAILVTAGDAPFAELAPFLLTDQSGLIYDLVRPDRLGAGSGASAVLAYDPAGQGAAAVAFGDEAGARGVVLGFPFESVAGDDARAEVMGRIVDFLGVARVEPPDPIDPVDPPPPDDGLGSGCGCRVGGRRGEPTALVLVLLLLGVVVGTLRRP
jgi:N-acetylmuramoyl-L-alanine amidase